MELRFSRNPDWCDLRGFGLENGVFFSALVWIIELEVKRARVALWPECDNAMRWIMGEHGFEYDASPQIYNKEP